MTESIAVWAIVIVLWCHWVADFVWQPHWMGMRKSKEWWVLTQHAARISAGMMLCAASILGFKHGFALWDHLPNIVLFGVVNGAAHFAIDAVTSRITSKLWSKQKVHDFFVVIGFDQFLHGAFAFVTLAWWVL